MAGELGIGILNGLFNWIESNKEPVERSINSLCHLKGGSPPVNGVEGPIFHGSCPVFRSIVGGGVGKWEKGGYRFEHRTGIQGEIRPSVGTRRGDLGLWWGTGWQAQVRENLGNHGGIFESRKERQRAAALRTDEDVDGEDSFEYLRPAHVSPR